MQRLDVHLSLYHNSLLNTLGSDILDIECGLCEDNSCELDMLAGYVTKAVAKAGYVSYVPV